MGIVKLLKKFNNSIEDKIYYFSAIHGERKKMKDKRRVKEYKSVVLTEEQEKEIQKYFKVNYGFLKDKAFTEFCDSFSEHPDSKLRFKGYKIDHVKEMIDIAYKCHYRTPHLGLISWDFTINDKNKVTLIEVNLNGQSIWFPQMANGEVAFGDNTEFMLNLIRK